MELIKHIPKAMAEILKDRGKDTWVRTLPMRGRTSTPI
jgi:hypothetical protein